MKEEDEKNPFEVKKFENFTILEVSNEKLDTNIAPAIKSELVLLAGNGEKNMVLDLSKCKYCDSSGLSAILIANRLCNNAKGICIVTGLQSEVERIIHISQLDTVLNITLDNDAAVSLIQKKEDDK